jgi:hypothetical protein
MDLAPPEPDEEVEYSRESFGALLAQVFYKRHQLAEAFRQPGSGADRFYQLATLAIADQRWGDVKELIEWQRATGAADARLDYVRGVLSAHEKQWDQAIGHFEFGLAKLEGDGDRWYLGWRLKQQLAEACVRDGRWLEYYQKCADPSETFEQLAEVLVAEKNWDDLRGLIAAHRRRRPEDARSDRIAAEPAWERRDYNAFAEHARSALQSGDEDAISYYERFRLEDRLLSALLRSGRWEDALQLGRRKLEDEGKAEILAIAHAARGNWGEAKEFARQYGATNDDLSQLYWHDDVGARFLSDEFAELHKQFPVELPYGRAPAMAIFLFTGATSPDLSAAAVTAAQSRLGIIASDAPRPLPDARKEGGLVRAAFVLPLGTARVWLAVGEGKFDPGWKLADSTSPLAAAFNESHSWLAVGATADTATDRYRAESLARRLAGELVRGRAAVACLRSRRPTSELAVYPLSESLLAAWQANERLGPLKDAGAPVEWMPAEQNVAAARQFTQALREAVRSFEASPDGKLEVVAGITNYPALDPLVLEVHRVERNYGSPMFIGTLRNTSLLEPNLRAGLPVRVHEFEVESLKLGEVAAFNRPR